MEHTDFNNKSNPLFDKANKCQTRKGGHASEFVAGDKATHTLKDDMRIVLEFLSRNDGNTADTLGKWLAMEHYRTGEFGIDNIDEIKKLINLPDKKMHKLVEHGLVRIEERPGGNRNWITDAGKAALKCG